MPLPRGLSRHVVRIVRLHDRTYAVKETVEDIAFREYRLLRDLQRMGLPAVVPQGVVTGRVDADGEELPAALLTEHLRFSLPYRSLFSHGLTAENLPSLIDALVVLLVRLHLADFFWGDVSLSNVLFRRSAGGFAAYLVDAETGELAPTLSARMREYDLTIATENVFAELLDLAGQRVARPRGARRTTSSSCSAERYDALWTELTAEEEFSADEMWRIEQRIERLNDLGFDVDELDIVTDFDGDRIRIQPKVVELGHHRRELQALTGLNVEDAQARRLLNDIASFTAHFDLGREDRTLVANRWLTQIYEPIMAMVPPERPGQARAGRDLPRDPRAPVVPLRARRPPRSASSTPPATTSTTCSPRSPTRTLATEHPEPSRRRWATGRRPSRRRWAAQERASSPPTNPASTTG